MTRNPCWPLGAVALMLTTVVVVGCNTKGKGVDQPRNSPLKPTSSIGANGKLFADWPKPAGALFISGQQDGFLEPCGCTEGQKGGLGRRYDLIERVRKQGWDLALIDLGSLVKDPSIPHGGGIEEQKLKFGVALRALEMMKYDAMAVSTDDMRLDVGEYFSLVQNGVKERPKVVAANVAPAEGIDPQGSFRPSIRTTAGPVKVGVTAILDPAAFEALKDAGKSSFFEVKDPAKVLPGVLADLEKDTDVQVLMVQGNAGKETDTVERAKALALAHPGFDIVVATSTRPDPDSEPILLNGGKTMLVTVGRKGQYVGVVGVFPDEKPRFRYQRVMLGKKYDHAEPIRKLLDEDFQDDLKLAKVVENYQKRTYVEGTPGATFIGAESCRACHPSTVARWETTGHAKAYNALLKPKRNREFDAECVSCHTTGFEYTSGFRSTELTPTLKGNQCENCHGPASSHAAEPDNVDFRKALALTEEKADKNHLCLRCHTEDDSPHFNFATYYPKIVHKKLDQYDDPKVHKGIAIAPAAK